MAIKMLPSWREIWINSRTISTKKEPIRLKDTIPEMKSTLEGIHCKLEDAEKWINDLLEGNQAE